MSLSRAAATRGALVVAIALGCNAQALGDGAHAPIAGPREVTAEAEGAVVATSSEALRAMLADPNGPKDVALLGRVYEGDLVIKRAVAIHGKPGSVLEGSGGSTVVTIDAHDVVLEDLVIRHSGHRNTAEDAGVKATGERIRIAHVRIEDTLFGATLEACKSCALERVHVIGYGDDAELRGDGIKLWEANDSTVRGCLVEHSRDVVVWYTKRATLEDNVVRGGRYGTHLMYAHDAVIRRSHLEGNVVGIFVMYSRRMTLEKNVLAGARGAAGIGLGFKDSDGVVVRGNWLVANTTGTYLDNTPRTPEEPVLFDGNVLALNDVALRLHSSEKGLTFHGNELRQNSVMLESDGGGDALAVDLRNNHYSDYEGYDLDRNGVGDVPYEVKLLSSELTDARPMLKFFHGTAAFGLVDAVAHAVPVFAARTLLSDPAPLVFAPEIAPQ